MSDVHNMAEIEKFNKSKSKKIETPSKDTIEPEKQAGES
ncbi:thymosin beta-4-like [Ursus americanus]|uniref:Thymosin beta-4-like n=1 Tax=Ursus maritimus TaxID=29073 RepID=A0A384BT94_URSMA|nr:thymosin beta-4-like [Ursus maritimus]XP_044237589.3 thymosin beta-4-like [Ursus arctos]XP_045662073.1 thymosin beta-4-like [Ursus americanus]